MRMQAQDWGRIFSGIALESSEPFRITRDGRRLVMGAVPIEVGTALGGGLNGS